MEIGAAAILGYVLLCDSHEQLLISGLPFTRDEGNEFHVDLRDIMIIWTEHPAALL